MNTAEAAIAGLFAGGSGGGGSEVTKNYVDTQDAKKQDKSISIQYACQTNYDTVENALTKIDSVIPRNANATDNPMITVREYNSLKGREIDRTVSRYTSTGKNLYFNSPYFVSFRNNELWTSLSETHDGYEVRKRTGKAGGIFQWLYLDVGTYTFSSYVKTDDGHLVKMYPYWHSDAPGEAAVVIPVVKKAETSTEWTRLSYTFSVDAPGVVGLTIERFDNDPGDLYISEFQLERGDTATAFEPYNRDAATTMRLDNAADARLQSLTIQGASKTSKNLLNPDYSGNEQARVSVTHDTNNITITATAANAFDQFVYHIPNAARLHGKTVSLSIDDVVSSNARCDDWRILLLQYVGNTETVVGQIFNGSTSAFRNVTATFDNGTTDVRVLIRVSQGKTAQIDDYITVKKIQLEVSDRPTAYEPYSDIIKNVGDNGLTVTVSKTGETSRTLSITTGLPLCSIPDTQYNDIFTEKSVSKQCGCVDLSTLTWTIRGQSDAKVSWKADVSDMAIYATGNDVPDYYSAYRAVSPNTTWVPGDISHEATQHEVILVTPPGTTTTELLMTYIAQRDKKLIYPLATPVSLPLSAAEQTAFRNLRTFDGDNIISATDDPEMTVSYILDTDNGKAVKKVQDEIVPISFVTQAEYDALPSSKLTDGVLYFVN